MKKILKFILAIALIVTILVLYKNYRILQKEYSTIKNEYQRTLADYKDKPLIVLDTIRDTVSITSVYEPNRTTGNIEDYVSKGLADTMAMKLKTASKRIHSLESYVINLKDSLQGIRHTDHHGTEWITSKNDPVFDIRVNLLTDTIYAGARIGIDRANARVRKSVFHPWEYRAAIRARDPRITITDIRDVQQVPKPSKFGIGLTAGPTFTTHGITYGVSAGLTYDIISF